jgi:GxxExxY protein
MSADSVNKLNELSHQIIGMAIEIHKKLGPGFQEKIYEEALLKEFEKAEIEFQRQKVVRVDYDGQSLGNQRIDLLVDDGIILERRVPRNPRPSGWGQGVQYRGNTMPGSSVL